MWSIASNSNSCGRPNVSSQEDSQILPKPRRSNDIGWNYGTLIKKGSYIDIECNKCNKIVKREIHILNQPIAGIRVVSVMKANTYVERT